MTSNYETGDGYGDILARTEEKDKGIVIEAKFARDGNLEKGVEQALAQIEKKRYDDVLRDEGCGKIWKYGIACNKKRCRVALVASFPQDAG